jgi:hypothetical protein
LERSLEGKPRLLERPLSGAASLTFLVVEYELVARDGAVECELPDVAVGAGNVLTGLLERGDAE